MLTGLIIFIILGALIGLLTKGRDGAGKGALAGFASFMVIATSIVLPLLVMLLLIRSCF